MTAVNALPVSHCTGTSRPTSVYRYYDKNSILIYVGITSAATGRQRQHNMDKEWWKYVHHQSVEHFPDRAHAHKREVELINKFRPPFNKQHNPDHAGAHRLYLEWQNIAPSSTAEEVILTKAPIPLVYVRGNAPRNEATFATDPSVDTKGVTQPLGQSAPVFDQDGKQIGHVCGLSPYGLFSVELTIRFRRKDLVPNGFGECSAFLKASVILGKRFVVFKRVVVTAIA